MQSTPARKLNAPVWLGVAWIDQAVPFQASASVFPLVELNEFPTAVQAVVDAQEIADRYALDAPAGLGVALMLHELPFHDSARVVRVVVPLDSPAAMHEVEEKHETPDNEALRPAGLGEAWTVQAVPFHASTRVADIKVMLSVVDPTAVQADAAVHATPDNESFEVPVGLGVAWMFQVVPFHDSASVVELWVELSDAEPTAVHAVAEAHDTEFRDALVPGGLGVVRMLQAVPFHASARVNRPDECEA